MKPADALSSATRPPGGEPNAVCLRLYVCGATPKSSTAVVNTRRFCETHLIGRYELEILEIADHIRQAREDQIVAAPSLLKLTPLPVRRFIGDMSNVEHLLKALNVGVGS